VNVLAVTPGPVKTPFFDKVGSSDAAIGPTITPEHVVRSALRGLERNRGYLTPGAGNFAMTHLMPRRPRRFMALASRTVTRSLADTVTPA
jgi:short-subunit dehydrogenase